MEPYLVIGLLLIAVVIFATEKVSVDIVTLALLCVLVLSGILKVDEAFAGFSNDVIVMLGSIFVIGAAMRETGVLDSLGAALSRKLGGQPTRLTAVMMSAVGGVSGFMNNGDVSRAGDGAGEAGENFTLPFADAALFCLHSGWHMYLDRHLHQRSRQWLPEGRGVERNRHV